MRHRILSIVILVTVCRPAFTVADEGVDFFEKKIRPVLIKHCYQCHSADAARKQKLKGQLQLDTREGVKLGGESGRVVVSGKPSQSTLISALKHNDFEMPPGKKLPEAVIRDFEHWVAIGAPDPRDGRPVASRSGIDYEAGRKHWAYQPLDLGTAPVVQDKSWPTGEIDRYVLARLESEGLNPTTEAAPLTVLRRLCFDLIGLPPTLEQVKQFESVDPDDSKNFRRRTRSSLMSCSIRRTLANTGLGTGSTASVTTQTLKRHRGIATGSSGL